MGTHGRAVGPSFISNGLRRSLAAFRRTLLEQGSKGAPAAAYVDPAASEALKAAIRERRERSERRWSLILNRGETKTCEPVFAHDVCARGHETPRVWACAKRRCGGVHCRRHALRERQRLLRLLMLRAFPGRWGVLVLTYAPELRPLVATPAMLGACRRVAAALVEQFFLRRAGLGKGWRLGVVAVDHPEGDKTPGVWKPHHNFLLPLVAFGPGGARKGLRYMLEPAELAELRALWRWGQEFALGRGLGRSADVWYQFQGNDKAKLHQLEYVPRTFPAWPASGQRLSYLGAFGANVIRRLAEVAKLDLDGVKEKPTCPVCKSEIVGVISDCSIPSAHRRLRGHPP